MDSKDAFCALQAYLYTGRCPLTCQDWEGVLVLAKRLCLDQLSAQAEVALIRELQTSPPKSCNDNAKYVLGLFNLATVSRLSDVSNITHHNHDHNHDYDHDYDHDHNHVHSHDNNYVHNHEHHHDCYHNHDPYHNYDRNNVVVIMWSRGRGKFQGSSKLLI